MSSLKIIIQSFLIASLHITALVLVQMEYYNIFYNNTSAGTSYLSPALFNNDIYGFAALLAVAFLSLLIIHNKDHQQLITSHSSALQLPGLYLLFSLVERMVIAYELIQRQIATTINYISLNSVIYEALYFPMRQPPQSFEFLNLKELISAIGLTCLDGLLLLSVFFVLSHVRYHLLPHPVVETESSAIYPKVLAILPIGLILLFMIPSGLGDAVVIGLSAFLSTFLVVYGLLTPSQRIYIQHNLSATAQIIGTILLLGALVTYLRLLFYINHNRAAARVLVWLYLFQTVVVSLIFTGLIILFSYVVNLLLSRNHPISTAPMN